MLQFMSNAFNDPHDPWYYVIGVLFLLLVFGAVAAYVILSGKKKGDEPHEQEPNAPTEKESGSTELSRSELSESEEQNAKTEK